MSNPVSSRNGVEVLVWIYKSELAGIIAEAKRFPDLETGGDLYGTFSHGNAPVIWLASGPGPKAKHHLTDFEQDIEFINHWQEKLHAEFGIQYIGTWHSHHRINLPEPSSGDVDAARRYALKHDRRRTLEIIVNHVSERDSIARPFFYPNAQEGGWVPSRFQLLSVESPLRTRINSAAFSSGLTLNKILSLANEFENRGDSSSFAESAPEFSTDIQTAIGLIDVEPDRIEAEERGDLLMLILWIDESIRIAIVIRQSKPPEVVRVSVLDKEQHVDVTDSLGHTIRSFKLHKRNISVLKEIVNEIMSSHMGGNAQ